MIRATPYKPKIGRDYAFAIGLRDLAQSLNDVPQELQLIFSRASTTPDNKVVAMSAGYHHIPEHGIGPGWVIGVRAVARADKGQIRIGLIENAIPRMLKPWLIARVDLLGRRGEEVLELVFSPADGTFTTQPGYRRRALEPIVLGKGRA